MKQALELMSGNDAVAHAVKACRVDLVSAMPITPVGPISEKLAQFVADGELDARFIEADGEHSVMSILTGACIAGCRTFTATCGAGLGFMNNPVFNVPVMRLPIVMAIGNRPQGLLDFLSDHSDSMSVRDSGWIQLYVEDNQEAVDTVIQAYRIAEDSRVLLPVMMCFDGWYLSYLSEPVAIPSQETVDAFLPPFRPEHLSLDPEKHLAYGYQVNAENYNMEFRCKLDQAMGRARDVIAEAGAEYGRLTGRAHGLVEPFMAEDADVVLVTMGSTTGTARQVVKEERARGRRVGLVKVRSFRPFPGEALTEAVRDAGAVVVLDRSLSFGGNPPLYGEVASTLCPLEDRPMLMGAYAGVGGRDVTEERLRDLIGQAFKAYKGKKPVAGRIWVGFNGGEENRVI